MSRSVEDRHRADRTPLGDQIDQSQGVRSRPQRPLDDVLSVVAVVRLRPIRVLVNDFEGFRQAGLVDQVDTSSWPATVPAVEQLLCEGLELPPGLAVLVGENGTGKSTVVEMLAEACGLNREGQPWPSSSGPGTASPDWARS